MPPRGLLDFLAQGQAPAAGKRPEVGPYRGILAASSHEPASQTGGSRIDELWIPDLERFQQNYVEKPIAQAASAALGLPGDAYLAMEKLLALPYATPAQIDKLPHLIPTSGDIYNAFFHKPPEWEASEPGSSAGRIVQAGLTGAVSVPISGGRTSLPAILSGFLGEALPQGVKETTDNPNAHLAAALLPLLLGAIKPVRSLPGIGDVGKSRFKSFKLDLGRLGEGLAYRNPTEAQMRSLAALDPHDAVRWFRDSNGDVWAFTGGNISHRGAALQLGYDDASADRGALIWENGKWKIFGGY